ncbi:MAG: SpoIIE family protein phosphatase [Candidatus Latescibacteria bacterium]|nr:SpoIIE family protein phosphatase [Candidatus Latescibacterota bacterium]
MRDILQDEKGNLWLAFEGRGASCWDGHAFRNFTTEDGLVFDRVLAILQDPEGAMWFGTNGSGAGCPFPLHYRAATGQIADCESVAYPLGMRRDNPCAEVEINLEPGDRLVFYSDGIPEASDGDGLPFGFERTAEVAGQGGARGLGPRS